MSIVFETRLSLFRTLFVIATLQFLYSPAHAQIAQLQIRVTNAVNNDIVHPYSAAGNLTVPEGHYRIELLSDIPVARMRIEARNDECSIDATSTVSNGDDPTTSQDDNPADRFVWGSFEVTAERVTCQFVFNAWYENFQWAGHLFTNITFESGEHLPVTHSVTVGTDRKTEMDTSNRVVAEQAHGTRVYCPVSHFSHDDPVVHPGEPSAAHLHMFWGNTKTDAFSTTDSLLSSGKATCEGGLNNKSAYWAPALFNQNHEVVLPEGVIVYYKSFSHTSGFDRNSIMPIPNGLQMLANQDVLHSGPWNFRVEAARINGKQLLRLSVAFPMCLQVDPNGSPVLSSADNVSHLSYSVASRVNSSDCPASHPYRIPQLSYNIRYDVPFDSRWYLASDSSADSRGSSLHADYIAAWDEQTMNRIVQCNRESRAACQFIGRENGQRQVRTQLPERFLSPEGIALYSDSVTLLPDTDRTPFGTLLRK